VLQQYNQVFQRE